MKKLVEVTSQSWQTLSASSPFLFNCFSFHHINSQIQISINFEPFESASSFSLVLFQLNHGKRQKLSINHAARVNPIKAMCGANAAAK
jgi:hypothetical protein